MASPSRVRTGLDKNTDENCNDVPSALLAQQREPLWPRIHPAMTTKTARGERGRSSPSRRTHRSRKSSLGGESSCERPSSSHEPLSRQQPSQVASSSLSSGSTRRSLSDSVVRRPSSCSASSREWSCSNSSGHHHHYFPQTNATFSLVQRSGAGMVRDMIASMDRKVEAAAASSGNTPPRTPEAELAALARCSLDPYYRVILAASGGLCAILRAMSAFPFEESVQANGCATFAAACSNNASNQSTAGLGQVQGHEKGALEVILEAMERFPTSVGVQSAGCDALNHLTSRCERNVERLRCILVDGFENIVENALERFLPSSCREGAETVLRRTRTMNASAS